MSKPEFSWLRRLLSPRRHPRPCDIADALVALRELSPIHLCARSIRSAGVGHRRMRHFGKAFLSSATPASVTRVPWRPRCSSLVSPLRCVSPRAKSLLSSVTNHTVSRTLIREWLVGQVPTFQSFFQLENSWDSCVLLLTIQRVNKVHRGRV